MTIKRNVGLIFGLIGLANLTSLAVFIWLSGPDWLYYCSA
jgi:hypothetical protein